MKAYCVSQRLWLARAGCAGKRDTAPGPSVQGPVRGNRLIVVAGVEARAMLAVAAGSRGT